MRLNSVLSRLEDFDSEKQKLKFENNTNMNELESKIFKLENELSKAH